MPKAEFLSTFFFFYISSFHPLFNHKYTFQFFPTLSSKTLVGFSLWRDYEDPRATNPFKTIGILNSQLGLMKYSPVPFGLRHTSLKTISFIQLWLSNGVQLWNSSIYFDFLIFILDFFPLSAFFFFYFWVIYSHDFLLKILVPIISVKFLLVWQILVRNRKKEGGKKKHNGYSQLSLFFFK